jgi:hypothetical protein
VYVCVCVCARAHVGDIARRGRRCLVLETGTNSAAAAVASVSFCEGVFGFAEIICDDSM